MSDPIVCQFHDLSHDGMGVGKLEGKVLFAEGVLPGEEAEVVILETKKNFSFAQVIKIFNPIKDRVEPICPQFKTCGGCQIMHLDYKKQLEQKKKRVVEQIKKTLGLSLDLAIESSFDSLFYRNKIELKLQEGVIGFYQKKSHEIVNIPKCYIAKPLLNEILAFLQTEKKALKDVTKITLRTNQKEDQATCIFHTEKKLDHHFVERFKKAIPSVKGIIQKNLSRTTVIDGHKEIVETVLGKQFFVDCEAFLQVNLSQAEKMYQTILNLIRPKKGDVILDAYCGIGILATLLAHQDATVIGMDIVKSAIDSAKKNQEQYGLKNLSFHVSAFEKNRLDLSHVNWLILNPPRTGLDPLAIKKVEGNSFANIIYVSCDPATLARDLKLLQLLGYTIEKGQLFDLFPQTMHVESLIVLKKK